MKIKNIAPSLSIFLLSACSGILPKGAPAPNLYTLNAPHSERAQDSMPHNLQILMPQAAPGLDTDRIALRRGSNQIDYFADTKWAVGLPNMMQSVLVEGFESSGALQSVSNDLVVAKTDTQLLVEIRDFQAEYGSGDAPKAHVRLIAKVINNQTKEIVSSASYEENAVAAGNTETDITAAFDQAEQKAVARLLSDSLQSIKADITAQAPLPR